MGALKLGRPDGLNEMIYGDAPHDVGKTLVAAPGITESFMVRDLMIDW